MTRKDLATCASDALILEGLIEALTYISDEIEAQRNGSAALLEAVARYASELATDLDHLTDAEERAGRATNGTPILRLFHEHRAIREAAAAHVCAVDGKGEDAELERLFYGRSDQIEAQLMALPCTCAADFAAKLIVDTHEGETYSHWETGAIWQEARALTGLEARA
ncbi:MAG: hypothetical protein CL813_06185 [Confluentimicrobium sp.]|nr:hypothetical protein [Actibacterium sp.]